MMIIPISQMRRLRLGEAKLLFTVKELISGVAGSEPRSIRLQTQALNYQVTRCLCKGRYFSPMVLSTTLFI